MSLRPRSLTALCLALLTTPAFAVDFDVHKASASLTGFIADASGGNDLLLTYRLSNSQIINLARGRGLKEKVPKNEILAGAGDFTSVLLGTTTGPKQLIVWDTTGQVKLATVLLADGATVDVAENHISNAFKRVGFGDALIQTTGNATNGFTGGKLRLAGLLRRTVKAGVPVPTITWSAHGKVQVTDASTAKTFFVTKGAITISGKRLGIFTE